MRGDLLPPPPGFGTWGDTRAECALASGEWSAALPAAGTLKGTAALSPGDVWAVGYAVNAAFDQAVLSEHWNGHVWKR